MHRYIPSEVLKGQTTDLQKADMFMLGITLYELTTCMDLPTGEFSYLYIIFSFRFIVHPCILSIEVLSTNFLECTPWYDACIFSMH